LHFHGECADGGNLWQFREDLFIDDRVYTRVENLDDLAPGKWFWERAHNEFDRNSYVVADPEAEQWTSVNRDADWQRLAEVGLEMNGALTLERRAPMKLSCDR
jgi:hypothetical protein